jgi:FAT domain
MCTQILTRCVQATSREPPQHWQATMGVMRCLASSADWEALLKSCRDEWATADSLKRHEMSALAAHAAWHMSDWKHLQKFVDSTDAAGRAEPTSTSALMRAVLAIQNGRPRNDFAAAERHISIAR